MIMIYPAYFDVKRSRRMGRRVPRSMAVQKPLLEELKVVAEFLKLDFEEEPEAKHPAAWWDESIGRLLVRKESENEEAIEKAKLIKRMAKYLVAVKQKKKEKQEQKEKKGGQKYQKPAAGRYQKPAAGRYQKPAGKYQK